ncbi:hypothetical protein [Lacimicrobium alkaliphilum]|uniref:Uncharacterized protein n=1 Tax=Lacimicrobium alkaliphilum TaxID=1526571 RepID=A0A0U3B191_9ALTE|nr:hypothetical protein [Lacimicrobium alkaliphilum]ALS98832.1 hypothetical protein AT746_11495 [Lacimicrobium alkaliphilum]
MGFQEKNAWACGCSILVVFMPYFGFVFSYPMAYIPLFAIAVFALVALLVGFHIINSIATASIRKSGAVPPTDELDRIIELRAARLAGMVLAIVVLSWSIAAMVGIPAEGVNNVVAANAKQELTHSVFAIQVTSAIYWIHLLFAGFVISNIVYYGSIVAGYRRLANG